MVLRGNAAGVACVKRRFCLGWTIEDDPAMATVGEVNGAKEP
jgi:hypothetical protein